MFKIGDKVRIIRDNDGDYEKGFSGMNLIKHGDRPSCPQIGIIKETNIAFSRLLIEYERNNRVICLSFFVGDVELIEHNEPSISSINKVGEIMGNIKTFVKNLALSADEKLLRKHGFKSECGEYSQDAKDLAVLRLCEEKETEMIEIAKGLEKEEKSSK